jgi:hypothetical protein
MKLFVRFKRFFVSYWFRKNAIMKKKKKASKINATIPSTAKKQKRYL